MLLFSLFHVFCIIIVFSYDNANYEQFPEFRALVATPIIYHKVICAIKHYLLAVNENIIIPSSGVFAVEFVRG